ncbi:MAG: hypothetical protein WAT12_02695, partial [Candidatus Nitrotoga sp.]
MESKFPRTHIAVAIVAALGLSNQILWAADISFTPPAGGGFVIKDSTGVQERFRVKESGAVLAPGLSVATPGDALLCFINSSGQMGPCPSGIATGPVGPTGPTGATGSAGPTGATGAIGPSGPTGATGAGMLSGAADPTAGVGNNGDYYFNSATTFLFGPKA